MTNQRGIVDALMKQHAKRARESEYDRSVSIAAISAARGIVLALPDDLRDSEYSSALLYELHGLMAGYDDPDGEFTSGKGAIGSLVSDIQVALK